MKSEREQPEFGEAQKLWRVRSKWMSREKVLSTWVLSR